MVREIDKDYRYDIYDKSNYIIDDNYVCLEVAIDHALANAGVVVRKAWYYLDENRDIDFDRHIEDEDVWVRNGWVFDSERFVELGDRKERI